MGAKEYSIAFAIAGKLAGDFAKTFKTANTAIQGLNQQIVGLDRQAGAVTNVLKLRNELNASEKAAADAKAQFNALSAQYATAEARVKDLAKAKANAKRAVSRLENEAKKNGVTTQEMSEKYDSAVGKVAKFEKELEAAKQKTKDLSVALGKEKIALDRSEEKLEKKRLSLKATETAAGTLSLKTAELVKRQGELAKSAERARNAQKKLAEINERVQKTSAIQTGLKANAMSSMSSLSYMAAGASTVAAPVMQAMSFEDQKAELRKFTDDYEALFARLKKLSLKYNKSTADMTTMAASLLQSQVAKTNDEVEKLIKTQLEGAIAFGMSSEQMGSAYTGLYTRLGSTQEKMVALFDYVNHLGNTTSASGDKIIRVMERSSGAMAGLTAMSDKHIAGLTGAFVSVTTSEEVAATAMMSFTNAMSAGAKATTAQQEGFERLGVDAVKLSDMMTRSPEYAAKAIQDVLARINKLPAAEKSALIGQIFGNEAGVKAAVATLAKQQQLIANNFEAIADPAKYAGSMLAEFQSQANTTSNALGLMQNAVQLVAGGIGEAMLPTVRSLAESLVSNSEGVIDWIKNNQGLLQALTKVGAVSAGLIAGFHAMRIVIWAHAGPVLAVCKAYQTYQATLVLAGKALEAGTKLTFAQTLALKVHTAATKVATVAKKAWAMALDGSLLALIKEKSALWANKIAVHAQTAAVKIATLAQKAWAVALVVGPLIAQKAVLLAHKAATLAHVVAIKGAAIAQKAWAAALFFGPLVAQKVAVLALEAATMSHVVAINGAAIAQKAWLATLAIGPLVAQKAALIALQGAMLAWKGVCMVVTVAQKALNFVLMANPIGLVITAVGGLVAAGVALYQNWDAIKQKVKELWEWISNFFGKIGETIAGTWEKVKSFFGFGSKETTVNVASAQKAQQTAQQSANSTGKRFSLNPPEEDKRLTALAVLESLQLENANGDWDKMAQARRAHEERRLGGTSIEEVQRLIQAEEAIKAQRVAAFNQKFARRRQEFEQEFEQRRARMEQTFIQPPAAVPAMASGGIVTSPTLALVGEGRESEAVLPLSKLDGLLGRNGSTSNSVNVNLTVNVSGASQDAYAEVKRGIAEGSASLKRELERLLNDQRRLSYV